MINHEYLELFNEGSVRKDIDIVYDTDQHISNSDVVSGTFSLNESAFTTKELRFGLLVASELSVKLYNTVPNLMDKEISVSIALDNMASNPLKIGKYKVLEDKPTTDRLYKQIKAYDSLYEVINKEVVSWYEGLLFPMTLKVFRDSFFVFLGIEQENTTLINDDMLVDKTILANSIPGKQVLSAICELNGAIGRMNRDGKFEYVILDANPTSRITIDNIASKSGSYEDFDCQPISKVQIRQTTDDIGAIVGEDGNTYIMQDNFLVYGKSASDLNTIATNLLSIIKGITYTPFNVKAIYGNPCYEIGDAITVVTANKTFNSYMFNRTLKGIQAMTDNIKADGVEYYTENLNSANTQIQQLARQTNELSRTVEETKSIVSSLELNNEFTNVALGKEITLEDSGAFPLVELYGYGKSVPDGEPKPDEPINIVSVADDGNLVITTTNNDTLSSVATIPLTDSLRGIKVTKGGNYTDETGQQWVCDTIEKYADGSGKLVQRVGSYIFDGSNDEGWGHNSGWSNASCFGTTKNIIPNIKEIGGYNTVADVICSHFEATTAGAVSTIAINGFGQGGTVGSQYFYISNTNITATNDLKTWLSNNNVEVIYVLATPIETPLTAEQIAEIEKLQTFNPITHVTTDDIGDIAIRYYNNSANAEVVAAQGNRISKAESSITQNAENIELKVDKNGIISSINQSAEEIRIQADKIKLEGTVTANDNFKVLEDGSMEAKNGTFTGAIVSDNAVINGGNINLTANSADEGRLVVKYGNYLTKTSAKGFQALVGNVVRTWIQGSEGKINLLNASGQLGIALSGSNGYIQTNGEISTNTITVNSTSILKGNVTSNGLIETSGSIVANSGFAVGSTAGRTAIRCIRCGTTVVSVSNTSYVAFATDANCKAWYSGYKPNNTVFVVSDGDDSTNTVRFSSTVYDPSSYKWYVMFNAAWTGSARINWTCIMW